MQENDTIYYKIKSQITKLTQFVVLKWIFLFIYNFW